MTSSQHRNLEFPQNRDALIERAAEQPDICVSVGGLAYELGLLRGTSTSTPRVFGKLIELTRRRLSWSAEQLAEAAGIDLAELVSIESDRDFIPQPQTVLQLAHKLRYRTERLMELTGLTTVRSGLLYEAAVQFAVRLRAGARTYDRGRAGVRRIRQSPHGLIAPYDRIAPHVEGFASTEIGKSSRRSSPT